MHIIKGEHHENGKSYELIVNFSHVIPIGAADSVCPSLNIIPVTFSLNLENGTPVSSGNFVYVVYNLSGANVGAIEDGSIVPYNTPIYLKVKELVLAMLDVRV